MADERRVLLCPPYATAPNPLPGHRRARCERCGQAVMVAASSEWLLERGDVALLCQPCGLEELVMAYLGDDEVSIRSAWERE